MLAIASVKLIPLLLIFRLALPSLFFSSFSLGYNRNVCICRKESKMPSTPLFGMQWWRRNDDARHRYGNEYYVSPKRAPEGTNGRWPHAAHTPYLHSGPFVLMRVLCVRGMKRTDEGIKNLTEQWCSISIRCVIAWLRYRWHLKLSAYRSCRSVASCIVRPSNSTNQFDLYERSMKHADLQVYELYEAKQRTDDLET